MSIVATVASQEVIGPRVSLLAVDVVSAVRLLEDIEEVEEVVVDMDLFEKIASVQQSQ